MIEHKLFLGIVERSLMQKDDHSPGNQHANRVQMRPLYCATDDLLAWQPIENVREEFPHNGFVTWFSPSTLVREGSLWQFHIKESFSFKIDNPRHDQYCIAETVRPWLAVEVIVLWEEEHLYNAEIIRRKLVEDGIWLKFTPASSVYFQVEENTVVGPIELVQKGGKWHAASAPLEQNSVRQYVFPEKSLVELNIDGAPRCFLRPKSQLGAPVRQLDWASDALVLKRVLRWLSGETSTDADTIKLTQSILDRAAAQVQHATEESGEATLHQYRLQRINQLLPQLQDNEQLAQTLMEDLPRLPFVAIETNKIIEQVRQQMMTQVSHELASEQQQLEEARLQKAVLEAETAQLERRLEQQVEEIDGAIAAQLTEIMNRPAEALADIAVMRAALNWNVHSSNASSAQLPPPEVRYAHILRPPTLPLQLAQPPFNEAKVLREQQELRLALAEEAAGICDASTLRTLHAAFLSGLVPVLAGSDAYEVLRRYAESAAGGRLLWVPVPATALEPGDLLGKFNSTAMRFVPQPNGLLDLLLCAQKSEKLFIVVLDGINRAPIDAYLSPLLALFADAWQEPDRRRALPLMHPAMLEQNGWEEASHLTWPPNVLLAAIWAEGAVSMPTPASFWNEAALIQVSPGTANNISARREANAFSSSAPFSVWRGWREQNQSAASAASSEVHKLSGLLSEDSYLLSRQRYSACSEMVAATRTWLQSEEDEVALHDLVACCFAPPLLAAGGAAALDKIVKHINKTGEELPLRIKRADLLLS